MRTQLSLAGLVTVGCLLGNGCAPLDDEAELNSHDWIDAGDGDAAIWDASMQPDMDAASADGGAEDAGEDAARDAEAAGPVVSVVPMPDASLEPRDAGAPKPDAETPKPDAGIMAPKPDAGPPKPDAGTPKPDAGPPKPDAGPPKPDAGPPKPDAGPPKPDAGAPKPDAGPPSVTFTQVYAIISGKCAFCHMPDRIGEQLGHLDMSSQQTAYSNLVGRAAAGIDCGGTGHVRVVQKDPAASLVIQKLEGTADCGVQMPDNLPPLSIAEIAVFRRWIASGAKND